LGGTLTALGSYDDCLESTIGDDKEDMTKGQYCAINIRPFLPPKPPLDVVEKAFNDAADAKGFAKVLTLLSEFIIRKIIFFNRKIILRESLHYFIT
jgi:hypothetical protein